MNRTVETYNEIKSQVKSLQSVQEVFTPLIREKHAGVLSGLSLDIPKQMAAKEKKDIRDFKAPQAENWKDVYSRSGVFLNQLIEKHVRRGESEVQNGNVGIKESGLLNVLVVSHGGFIMELFNYILFTTQSIPPSYNNSIPNCSISRLRVYCSRSKACCEECPDSSCV